MMNKEEMLAKLKSVRWPMFVIVCIGYMLAPFHRMAPAIMGPELMKDLNLNAVDFGLLGMTFTWAFAIAQFPMGALLDKLGPRKGMGIMLIFTALGSVMFAFAQNLTMVIVGRAIIGFALAAFLICGAKIVAAWYTSKDYPVMWSFFMALGTVGGIGATTPLQLMMGNYGWRNSFIIIAGASIALAVIGYLLLRNKPADHGLLTPDEIVGEVVVKEEAQPLSFMESVKKLVSMPKIWLSGLLALGINSSSNVLVSLWAGIWLADVYKLPKAEIGDILFWSAIGLVIGCAISGVLCRILKVSGTLVAGTVLTLVTWLYMLLNIHTLTVMELKLSLAFLGILQMCTISANFILIKELVGVSLLGSAMGLMNGFTWIFGTGLFQQIWGIIINRVSKGVRPFPLEAFQSAMEVQVVTIVVSIAIALYFAKTQRKQVAAESAK